MYFGTLTPHARGNPVLQYCSAFFEEPRSARGHPEEARLESAVAELELNRNGGYLPRS